MSTYLNYARGFEQVRETLKELLNNKDEQVRKKAENQLKQLNLSER